MYEGGAFPGSPLASGARCIFAAYDVANLRVDARDVVVNKQKVAAYRAPGAPAAAFAAEQAVDELARALKIDPLELRLANAAREGTRQVTGPKFGAIGCVETLEAAKEHAHYAAPVGGGGPVPKGKRRGRGVANGFWGNTGGPSACVASVNQDGTVSLIEGSPDIGGSRAAVAMQLAEVLGLRAEEVRPTVVDTDSIGFTSQTGGSSVAYKTGWAAYEAARDVKRQMIERAALVWGASPEDVEYDYGVLRHSSDPELKTTFAEIAARQMKTGGPIVGKAATSMMRPGGAYSAHIADVEVDLETGKVEVLRYTVAQDAGKAIHPSYVERSDAGRRRGRNRLGPERGVLLRRGGTAAEPHVPRLSHAHQPRRAHDRHGDRGEAARRAPVRGARDWRGPLGAADGGGGERGLRRDGRPHDEPADVAGQGAGSPVGETKGRTRKRSDAGGRGFRRSCSR